MAELTAFHYRTGNTMVHALDTRFKLVLLALASLTILNASVRTLAFASGAMVLLCLSSRIRLWSAARELRYFFVLLAMVFVARVLSTPGEPLVQSRVPGDRQERANRGGNCLLALSAGG